MSIRVDTAPLIAGSVVVGVPGLGVLGSLIPATGEHGPGYAYDDLIAGDETKEIRGLITTWPTNGTLTAFEDTSFEYEGTSDTFAYQLYVDGVARGSAVTHTITIGLVASTIARPSADISAGAWTPSTGSDLYAMVDEADTPSDADYISTSMEAACTLALSSTVGARNGHILRLRAWSPAADGLTAEILQGASVIATRSIANLPAGAQTYEFNLTGPEVAAITDYSTLRVRLTAVNATDPVTYVDPDYVDFDYVD